MGLNSLPSLFPRAKAPVIVMGMHRSGTSMFMRMLAALGVFVGNDISSNVEALTFQNSNRMVLKSCGAYWDNVAPVLKCLENPTDVVQYTKRMEERLFVHNAICKYCDRFTALRLRAFDKLWGWKDPRNSLTLPIWLEIFPDAFVINVIRNGVDVAISLHRRESKRALDDPDRSISCHEPDYCFRLWGQYVQASRLHSRSIAANKYLEVRYEDLLASPKGELERVICFLGRVPDARRMANIVRAVNRNRLDNSVYRAQYGTAISRWENSDVMVQLDYG